MGGCPAASARASCSAGASPAGPFPPNPNHFPPEVAEVPPASGSVVPAAAPAVVPVPPPAGANKPQVSTLHSPNNSAATAPMMAWRTAAMPVTTAVKAFATSDMIAPMSLCRF
ncbi:hypothetical protein L227DRAFT_572183 [Lentinus tigrinus ALCF2SS1-6]|uniref:Uncharacterized protein n=1 Tax=Lentinus tigrinus ALCF2SS1-6 TaxID=1328759 RepID=A0A5C2SKR5_9APHY|nr:hypothetical protein L227DRAFT_572183 [Lentinus tigrinus ALCF2SS1-6]